jgi:hypothetical protein
LTHGLVVRKSRRTEYGRSSVFDISVNIQDFRGRYVNFPQGPENLLAINSLIVSRKGSLSVALELKLVGFDASKGPILVEFREVYFSNITQVTAIRNDGWIHTFRFVIDAVIHEEAANTTLNESLERRWILLEKIY